MHPVESSNAGILAETSRSPAIDCERIEILLKQSCLLLFCRQNLEMLPSWNITPKPPSHHTLLAQEFYKL